ncbi:MAG: peptidoglycan-binding protein [Scytonematopsis contorta HA4267-MV1]|jgi:peptidoglycan hydrolase-like protein with peptidoglycan-binding domain|nr:peptidoglycan-binding protein [Scytonematopsis contorta HA4267-MV1]
MQGSLTASTFARLRSFIPFRLFPTYKFSFLILCSSAPLFLFSSPLISVARAQETVQVINAGSINRPTLRAGSQGDSVSELQGALKLLGYYTGEVDGNYNEQTVAAVSQFQKSAGLPADGIVAASTWQKLFPGLTTASASSGNSSNSATTRNETEGFSVPTQRTDNNRTTNSRSETKPLTRTTTASNTEPKPTPRATTASNTEPKPTPRATTASNTEPKPTPRATTASSSPEPRPATRNRNTSSQRENTTTSQGGRRTQTTQESTRTSSATRRNQTSSSNQETRSNQTTRANQGTRTQQTTPSSRTTQQNPGIQYTSAGMPILRLGMQGEEVIQLQRRLRRLGFFDGPVNGNFGTATETAVKAFQQKNGIEADGVVGGGTWVYLMPRRQQQR